MHDESIDAKKRKMIRKRKDQIQYTLGDSDDERTSEEERSRLLSVYLSGCLMWSPLYPDLSMYCDGHW